MWFMRVGIHVTIKVFYNIQFPQVASLTEGGLTKNCNYQHE